MSDQQQLASEGERGGNRAMGEMRNFGCSLAACAAAVALVVSFGPWWKEDPGPQLTELPEKLAKDRTTILVGDPEAPITVTVFEDPRCAMSRTFETSGSGAYLRELAKKREINIEYKLATFIDDKQGGGGSRKAVAALKAALDQEKFTEYHEQLYANQPPEAVDGYTEPFLLDIGSKVVGLRGSAFDKAVKNSAHSDYTVAVDQSYEAAGSPATPTIMVNGSALPPAFADAIYDKDDFAGVLRSYTG
ncbi:DsbA family protein [Streptomyces sp. SP18CS02]|uniref:DsbA family protein n=1 Tax=Streptomyces sp. SP18CS02 TaxID=3002531 RepID=UPI002E7830B5|nr:thioredoxin domain-containing protein [Streptomyces sp. SP18CS02]MEE1756425.1 thioredoxin domain-containing protein [Streptomyces sp. SP18CS02]